MDESDSGAMVWVERRVGKRSGRGSWRRVYGFVRVYVMMMTGERGQRRDHRTWERRSYVLFVMRGRALFE